MALLWTKTVDFGSGQRVGCVRSLSRKRILIRSASLLEDSSSSYFDFDCKAEAPAKKLCGGGDVFQCTDKSVFESLPLDVLIKIISGVIHEDLNQLFEVSNSICQAAKIAREFHFAFATPTKVLAFKIPISPGEFHVNYERSRLPPTFLYVLKLASLMGSRRWRKVVCGFMYGRHEQHVNPTGFISKSIGN